MATEPTTAERPTLPTPEELEVLPRLARIAYAARAARRVQPLYVKFWPEAPAQHVEAVDRAIAVAESTAEGNNNHACVGGVAGHAAYAADAGARAVGRAAYAPANAAAYAAADVPAGAAAAAVEAAAYAARDTIASCIRHDFDLLSTFSKLGKWTDKTPVSVAILGPLWPDGEPEWWREAPEAKPKPQREPSPDFLERAKRILSGEVRPEDYLPEPDEVQKAVTEHLRPIETELGAEVTLEAVRHLLNEWTLLHHHDGENVLAKYTDRGVLVLAAGGQQIYQVKQHFNPDSRSGFALMSPSTAW